MAPEASPQRGVPSGEARLRPSATGLTAVPQSRQHGKRGSSLRQSLRDRTRSGATVPSPQGTGRFPASAPPRRDPQRCHSPVSTGNGALPIGWRRSRGILAQVRKNGGNLRRETASSASQWRRTQRCATGRGDLRRKEDRRHQKEDLRHREKGPAPPEGRPAPPGEGTCAGRTDLRHRERGPAPPAKGTGATRRRDLLLRGRT